MDNQKELYTNLTTLLNCKDNTVSGEHFEVMAHKEYEMLVTSPVYTMDNKTLLRIAKALEELIALVKDEHKRYGKKKN